MGRTTYGIFSTMANGPRSRAPVEQLEAKKSFCRALRPPRRLFPALAVVSLPPANRARKEKPSQVILPLATGRAGRMPAALRDGSRKDARMRICLFEDRGALDFEPLSLTRPVFDLLCGLAPLSTKQARFFAPATPAALVRP